MLRAYQIVSGPQVLFFLRLASCASILRLAPCALSFLFYVAAPGRDAKGPRRALASFISPVFKEVLLFVSFEIVFYLGFSHLVSLDPSSVAGLLARPSLIKIALTSAQIRDALPRLLRA